MVETLTFELFPEEKLHLLLFSNVSNCEEILQKIMNNEIELALLNAEMVADSFHIHAAANKVLGRKQQNKLKTKNIHSELVHCLSGRKQIGEAFRMFGGNKSTPNIIIAIFNASEDEISKVRKLVNGTEGCLDDLAAITNLDKIREAFSIQNFEISVNKTLGDCVVSRVAIAD